MKPGNLNTRPRDRPEFFTIGQLAKLAGVNIETVRYYQRLGLLAEPRKPASGYRRYPVQAVEDICFIKRAQALGFTLREIASVFHPEATGACADVSALAAGKVSLLERRIAELTKVRDALAALVKECARCRALGAPACVIRQAMQG